MGKKKKRKGLLDRLAEDLIDHSVMELAKDSESGKVEPYAAAGIAFGVGKMEKFEDQM